VVLKRGSFTVEILRSNQTGAGNARILFGREADGAVRDGVETTRLLMQYMNSRREEATNFGLKVFMDARMPVTHKEGDRYPLGPPRLFRCSTEVVAADC
jgi:hypothetical protein